MKISRSRQQAEPRSIALPLHAQSISPQYHRQFFTAGIVIVLTAGAAWGAWLLWQVGRAGSFTGSGDVTIHAINAHGHAQIFGWVGLFIMGFAYQAFPRAWRARLAAPHFAPAVFILMLLGIALSTVGQWRHGSWDLATTAVIIGGFAQTVAILFFAGQIIATFRNGAERISPATGFIFMALVWFIVMSVMNGWHAVRLMTADSHDALLMQISTWQAPLRDLQIHGLALFMILGVSMRFFPGMFGLPQTPARRGFLALALLTIAVIGEVILLVMSRIQESTALAGMLLVPWIMLLAGCALVVIPWRLWRPSGESHRSAKFVRAAYAWLGISLFMLMAMPAYMALREMEFSHAYYGAVRHAITVGFISMMIMGVSSKVVPALRGIDHKRLSRLLGPFILINVGCAMRVSTQVASDWHEFGFSLIGFSGVIELSALTWWGVGLALVMFRRPGLIKIAKPDPEPRGVQIVPEETAGDSAACDCCAAGGHQHPMRACAH